MQESVIGGTLLKPLTFRPFLHNIPGLFIRISKHLLPSATQESSAESAHFSLADIPVRKAIFLTFLLGPTIQAQASEPNDWTQFLNDPRFMPAIKNCLAAHPKAEGPAFVMNVWHANLEEAGVMTTDLSGRRNNCFAHKDTGVLSHSQTVFDLPGPLFVSVDQAKVAPKGECIESTPVYIDQQLQGWILRQPILDPPIPSACSMPVWTDLLPSSQARRSMGTIKTSLRADFN